MAASSEQLRAHFSVAPFLSGACAGCCLGWHRWLWGLAAICSDHDLWTWVAVAAGNLLTPYYEKAFRGDLRLRRALETANELNNDGAPETREAAEQLMLRIKNIQCGGGVAGTAVTVSLWALRTALATHTAYAEGELPNYPLWWWELKRDESDWVYCSFMALTYAAHGMAKTIVDQRQPYPPKWRVANDEGKLRVQSVLRQIMVL